MIGSLFVLVIGLFSTVILVQPTMPSASSLTTTARNGIPVHGNWCGPGHFGSNSSVGCIDDLDCACKIHDFCYGKQGYSNCKCDNDLVQTLNENNNSKAIFIREFFAHSPCTAPRDGIPYAKLCQLCGKMFTRSVCTSYPCFGTKCWMLPLFTPKSSVGRYSCKNNSESESPDPL